MTTDQIPPAAIRAAEDVILNLTEYHELEQWFCEKPYRDEIKTYIARIIARECAERVKCAEVATNNGWLSIDTAPKDGTKVLVYTKEGCAYVAKWCTTMCAWYITVAWAIVHVPTHWRPLPPAPL